MKTIKTLILVSIFLTAALRSMAIPNVTTSGSLCVGQTIRITVATVSGCTGIKVLNQYDWNISPTPSSISYVGSASHWNAVDVVYNYATYVNVAVGYACNSGPGNEETGYFGVSAAITPTVSPSASVSSGCVGYGTTLYANPTNQGTNPAYAFYVDSNLIYSGSSSSVGYSTTGLTAGSHSVYVTMVNQNAGCFSPSASTNGTTSITMYATPYQGSLSVNNGNVNGCVNLPIYVNLSGNSGSAYYNVSYQQNSNPPVNVENTSSLGNSFNYNPYTWGQWTFETWSQTGCGNSSHISFTVTVWAQPDLPVIQPVSSICPGQSVTLQATGYQDGSAQSWMKVRWYDTSTSTTPLNADPYNGDLATGALSATRQYWAASYHVTAPGVGCDGPRAAITVTVNPTPGLPSPTGLNNRCGPGSVVLTATPGTNGNQVLWFESNGTAFSGTVNSSTQATTPSLSSTTNYSIKSISAAGCIGSATTIVATIAPVPGLPGVTGNACYGYGALALSATAGSNASTVNWFSTATSLTPFTTGLSYTTPQITETTIYYVSSLNTTSTCQSARKPVVATIKALNAVSTYALLVPGVTNPANVSSLTVDQASKSTTYIDGLGRTIQTVSKQGSPAKYDLAAPVVYDIIGRESKKYLPFAAEQTGLFKATESVIDGNGDYAGIALPFYSTTTDKIADDTKPYSKTVYEPSPLNRPGKQGAPGLAWQPDATNTYASTDRTVKKSYEVNASNEVLNWTFTYPTVTYPFGIVNAGTAAAPAYYTANYITKNRTKDEQGNEVIEYVDKLGHTVLKRVQVVTGSPTINDTNYASTYYIYDDFGSLVCVIPPEATSRLATEYYQAAATDATKDSFLKRWGFRYAYDARVRMILKQVPGANPVYMVYDAHDRLILTQDGNQRAGATQYWSFTKYDLLNRPVQTGIKDTSVALTQVQMQAVVDAHFAKAASKWGESYIGSAAGNVHGYSNKAYPARTGSVSTEVDPNKYLSVTYYDDYSFKSIIYDSASYSYITTDLPGDQATNYFRGLKGLVTGTKIKVLDGGVTGGYTWLKSVNYYDDRKRGIQAIVDNYKGGTDRTTSVFDFVGKVLKTKTTHTEKDVTWKDKVGVTLIGNKLVSTGTSGWGNSGAASLQQLASGQNGWAEMISSELTTYKMLGLSDANTDASYLSLDYAIYQYGTNLMIYENGTLKYTSSPVLVPGEALRIERNGTSVTYKRNGVTFYVSTIPSSTLLMADVAHYYNGGTLVGIRSSFSTTSHSIVRRFTYDHAGRLLKTFHTLDGGTEILLAQNIYNELGQLVDKALHSTDNGATSKQSTDYRYNIRGWLTSVNNAKLTNDGVMNDDTNDLFGMELGYDNSIGTGNTSLFNGNISGMKWSRNLALGVVKDVAYNYSYDPMNRLLSAAYKKDTLSAWSNSKDVLSESGYSYDLNGNIMGLTRKNSNGASMDVLTYNYGAAGTYSNRLLLVGDTGDKAKGFIEPTSTTGDDYSYDVNGNMITDKNKGITAIAYNHLNLPVQVTKSTNEYIKYIYDAGGRKLNQGVYNSADLMQKSTDYDGEFFYENDTLKFINHEEGRIVMKPTTGEYQYNLKDHLGNVRTTFTTLASSDVSTATLETANATIEQSKFLRYTSAETVYATLFDHTNGASPGYSQRLNGSANEKYGLAKSLSVMPGDVLQLEVYAKYPDLNSANWNATLTTLMGQIAANTGNIVIDGMNFATSTATFPAAYPGLLAKNNNGAPKAYLNWLIFNRDFGFVTGGFKQITTAAKETGTDGPHERVAPASDITITEPGYVYVWLSNEETTPVEVYFDDFKVTHVKSPVIQTDDYYAGGFVSQSYQRENSVINKYLFSGKELQTDLGLNLQDYGPRMFDPAILRWNATDPHAERYPDYSPYSYCYNNPVNVVDRDGRDAIIITFPDFKIDTESPLGKVGGIGHAGVLLIDNQTGRTKYYEYGRYPTEDGTKGRVRNVRVSDVKIGPDGKPTSASLQKVLGQISKDAGHRGNINGAYVESDNFDAMNDYAQKKLKESNPGNDEYDSERESYSLLDNNCGTFACDVVKQDGNVSGVPNSKYDTPNGMMKDAQIKFDKVTYDSKTKATTYSVAKSSFGQILDMLKKTLNK